MTFPAKPDPTFIDTFLAEFIEQADADGYVDGGCSRCDAYQTADASTGIVFITVHHDDWCPLIGGTGRPSTPTEPEHA